MFTSTFNRSRANLNGSIRNTFIVFLICWNQSETILLQGSRELLISLLYMRKRALGRDWRVHLNMAALLREVILHFIFYLFIYLFKECTDLSVFLSDFIVSSYFLSLEQKYRLISSVENKTIASEQILVIILDFRNWLMQVVPAPTHIDTLDFTSKFKCPQHRQPIGKVCHKSHCSF